MRHRIWKCIGPMLIITCFICMDLRAQDLNDFGKLTLQINTQDQNTLPLEPLPITITLSNSTTKTIKGHSMINPGYGFIEIYVAADNLPFEKFRTADWLLLTGLVGDSNELLEPGFTYSVNGFLYYANPINLEKDKGRYLFEKHGIYHIKAILKDGNFENKIESNVITIEVKQPVGENADAYEFLKGVKDNNDTSYSAFLMRNFGRDMSTRAQQVRNIKEEFISRFPNSHYAPYVFYSLGIDYCLGVDKGVEQGIHYLEKVESFKDCFLAEEALNRLVDISIKQENLDKAKSYLEILKKRFPENREYYEAANEIDKIISEFEK